MLNEVKNKFVSATYKGVILLPTFLSWIIIRYIVFGFLSYDKGIVNDMITSWGGTAINWYIETKLLAVYHAVYVFVEEHQVLFCAVRRSDCGH